MPIKHTVRTPNGEGKVVELTRKTAIIMHCKECSGDNAAEARRCTVTLCPLFPFRTWDKPESNLRIIGNDSR